MPSASSCQNASSSCVGPWNPSALDRLDVSTGVQPLSANGSESQTQQIYFVASWKAPDSDGLQPNSAGLPNLLKIISLQVGSLVGQSQAIVESIVESSTAKPKKAAFLRKRTHVGMPCQSSQGGSTWALLARLGESRSVRRSLSPVFAVEATFVWS